MREGAQQVHAPPHADAHAQAHAHAHGARFRGLKSVIGRQAVNALTVGLHSRLGDKLVGIIIEYMPMCVQCTAVHYRTYLT